MQQAELYPALLDKYIIHYLVFAYQVDLHARTYCILEVLLHRSRCKYVEVLITQCGAGVLLLCAHTSRSFQACHSILFQLPCSYLLRMFG